MPASNDISPIIIIGAPRSGTNMLRDLISQFDNHGTWPCDEINLIWRYGNRDFNSDEFTREMATPAVCEYIKRKFDNQKKALGKENLVEKTCANSLRVGFVDQIFPDARYIFIVRDGVDVVSSAQKRWRAPLDIPYLLAKVRYVPKSDLLFYGWKFLKSRLFKVFSKEKRVKLWGPKFHGMHSMLLINTLNEVCAFQWQRCVESSERDLAQIDPGRVFKIKYEDLVTQTEATLIEISGFLSVSLSSQQLSALANNVSSRSVGKGRGILGDEISAELEKLIGSTLTKQGHCCE